MCPTLTLEPLSNSTSFENIKVKLSGERVPYLVGFRLSEDPLASDVVDTAQAAPDWPGYKLDIVPYDSMRGSQMRHPLAAIWYTHFKVYILPAEHINVFFQRAMPNNERWTKIKTGHVFDLADPLMTVIDSAVHIRIETTPIMSRRAEFIKKMHDILHPDHSIHNHEHLVKHFHVGIERPEEFLRHSGKEILTKVSVTWSNDAGSKTKDEDSSLDPKDLMAESPADADEVDSGVQKEIKTYQEVEK